MHEGLPQPFPQDETRPLPQRLFGLFHLATHGIRHLMRAKLGEFGLHPSQALCLGQLAHHDGITQSELADLLGVTRPTVTVMVQKLEKSGMVERRVDEHDQRFTRLYVTDGARQVHDRMHEVFDEVASEMIGTMSERDQEELVRLLLQINENMAATTGPEVSDSARGKDDGR